MHGDWEVLYVGAPAEVRELESRLIRRNIETLVPERVDGSMGYGGNGPVDEHGVPIYRIMVPKAMVTEATEVLQGAPDAPVVVPLEGNEHLLPSEASAFEPVCPGCGNKTFDERKLPSIGLLALAFVGLLVITGALRSFEAPIAAVLAVIVAAFVGVWKLDLGNKHRCTSCGRHVTLDKIRQDRQAPNQPSQQSAAHQSKEEAALHQTHQH